MTLHWRLAVVPSVALIALLGVWLSGVDHALFQWINQQSRLAGDYPWAALTLLGESVVWFALLALVQSRWPEAGWAVLCGGVVAALLGWGLKIGVDALRPPMVLPAEALHVIGPVLRHYSFPSGHTTTAMLIGTVVMRYTGRRWLQVAAVLVALAVGWSRMAMGVHWPTDVLAGIIIGWMSALAGVAYVARWPGARSRQAQRVLAAIFALCALALFVDNSSYEATRTLQWLIATVTLAAATHSWWRLRARADGG